MGAKTLEVKASHAATQSPELKIREFAWLTLSLAGG
jgi:hypothetical protein